MSEVMARLAIYRDIDRLAAESDEDLERIASLIGPYQPVVQRSPARGDLRETTGWSDRLIEFLPDDSIEQINAATEWALGEFARLDESPEEDDTLTAPNAARRIRTLWIARQLLGWVDDSEGFNRALMSAMDGEARDLPPVQEIFQAPREEDSFSIVRQELRDAGQISPTLDYLLQVQCEEDVVELPFPDGQGGIDHDYAARLTTDVEVPLNPQAQPDTSLLTDEIAQAIDPSNWVGAGPTRFNGLWCDMLEEGTSDPPTPSDGFAFRECVGPCPEVWFKPILRFHRSAPPRMPPNQRTDSILYYDLDSRPFGINPANMDENDPQLRVDYGHIRATVRADGAPTLRIRTSKTLLFDRLGWGGTAVFACAIGYGDAAKEMLAHCLGPIVDLTN